MGNALAGGVGERLLVGFGSKQRRDHRAADLADRAVQRLEPVIEIGETVRVFAEVAGRDVVVTGRGDEES